MAPLAVPNVSDSIITPSNDEPPVAEDAPDSNGWSPGRDGQMGRTCPGDVAYGCSSVTYVV